MKKKELKSLAREWMRRSNEDDLTGRAFQTVRVELKMAARVRRNCAWELLRLLRETEKENPAEAGVVSAPECELPPRTPGLSPAIKVELP